MNRRLPVTLTLVALVLIVGFVIAARFFHFGTRQTNTTSNPKPTQQAARIDTTPKQKDFDKGTYSLTDPTSIWVVVNKNRPLQPKNYVPTDLVVPTLTLRSNITGDERQVRTVTAEALKTLADAAKTDGVTLTLESGYRSYNFQVTLYNRYVSEQGKAVADTQSARAGYSEHQTGLAADLGGTSKPSCNVEQCFADTSEGKWLAAHAYMYGFIIRYPLGKDTITGYEYEPWHLRYVGKDLAAEMHAKGIQTLEEFFALPAAPDYN